MAEGQKESSVFRIEPPRWQPGHLDATGDYSTANTHPWKDEPSTETHHRYMECKKIVAKLLGISHQPGLLESVARECSERPSCTLQFADLPLISLHSDASDCTDHQSSCSTGAPRLTPVRNAKNIMRTLVERAAACQASQSIPGSPLDLTSSRECWSRIHIKGRVVQGRFNLYHFLGSDLMSQSWPPSCFYLI